MIYTDKILFISVIGLLVISILLILYFSLNFRKENIRMFDSRIDGLFIISENNAEPEITIRDLVTYLSCNDIRCFRKIYIKCKNISPEKTEICRKICSDYPVLELYEK